MSKHSPQAQAQPKVSMMGGAVRQVANKIGYGRRWVQNVVLGLMGWVATILAAVAWLLIAMIVAGVLYWLAARMFAFLPPVAIRLSSQDLMATGVFVFCSAFALRSRT
jgi:hypothetical protein